MKKLTSLLSLSLCVGILLPAGAQGQFPQAEEDRRARRWNQEPQSGVCIYEDRGYRGRFECFDAGDAIRDMVRAGNFSDRVSSIRVFGRDRLIVYRDIHFQGERLLVDRDIPDLREYRLQYGRNWDNQISSLEVGGGGRRRR
jgi:hypothetical protein